MIRKNKVRYDGLLLTLLQSSQNEKFKLLSKDLLKSSTYWKTLLHHAAFYSNDVIARHLIDMGLDVNSLDSNGKTPLMIAVEVRSVRVVNVLLEANASIYIIDSAGKNVLKMVFDTEYFSLKILESILQRLVQDCSDVQELVDKLVEAGCCMYHATYLRDIQVMEMLMNRGIGINSRGYCNETALHVAAEMSDLDIAEWVLNKGGDVDAVNEYGRSALLDAAIDGKVELVRLLLKRGANPNTRHTNEYTPLFSIFAFSLHEREQANFDKCAELLLRHGAIPENSSLDRYTLFDYGLLNRAPNNKIEYVIGQLAILERLGKSTPESVLICNVKEHDSIILELRNIYESCKKLLEVIVYGELSLFDLLTENEDTMRIHVRNKTIRSRIDFMYPMLSKFYPYYFRILKKRISQAAHAVKLENAAVLVVPKLFNANYHLCYNFARQVVGYLNKCDLKLLCQV